MIRTARCDGRSQAAHRNADSLCMISSDRMSGRWIGIIVAGALAIGACGSSGGENAATTPETLPLEEAPAVASTIPAEDLDDVSSSSELDGVELTPEVFEELKTDPESRAAVLEEMMGQGLTADEAACFLDSVSPGLFATFGNGDQPNDAEFAELLELLDTCEIAFGAQS